MIHRGYDTQAVIYEVVNCFQNPNFRDDSQGSSFTSLANRVVNCFQNPNFRDDSQATRCTLGIHTGCELLSES